MTKDLAVCIPVWNRASLIGDAIRSVATTDSDVDIHVFDNASTDGTADIVEREWGKRVILHRNAENVGYVGNVNRCLAASDSYRWIAVLHSDDVYLPHAIPVIRKAMARHPEAGIIVGGQVSFAELGSGRRFEMDPGEILFSRPEQSVARAQRQLPCSSTVVNANVIKACGDYSEAFPFSADEEFCARVAREFDILEVKGPLSAYRRHAGQTMVATWRDPKFLESFVAMRLLINSYLPSGARLTDREVQRAIARVLLGQATILIAQGERATVRRFYGYSLDVVPEVLLEPRVFLRAVLHHFPLLGKKVCRLLSSRALASHGKQ